MVNKDKVIELESKLAKLTLVNADLLNEIQQLQASKSDLKIILEESLADNIRLYKLNTSSWWQYSCVILLSAFCTLGMFFLIVLACSYF